MEILQAIFIFVAMMIITVVPIVAICLIVRHFQKRKEKKLQELRQNNPKAYEARVKEIKKSNNQMLFIMAWKEEIAVVATGIIIGIIFLIWCIFNK